MAVRPRAEKRSRRHRRRAWLTGVPILAISLFLIPAALLLLVLSRSAAAVVSVLVALGLLALLLALLFRAGTAEEHRR